MDKEFLYVVSYYNSEEEWPVCVFEVKDDANSYVTKREKEMVGQNRGFNITEIPFFRSQKKTLDSLDRIC